MSEVQSTEITTDNNPNPPDLGKVVAMVRPDWVPEKFYDAKTGVIDFQSIAKSYGELERMKSAAPAPAQGDATSDETLQDGAAPKTPEPAPAVSLPSVPGIANDAMKVYSEELTKNGKLSDTSYEALTKAGYPKAVVDAYLKGVNADATVNQAVESARLADSQIAEIKQSVGGDAKLTEMLTWAKASLSPDDLKAYNDAVSSGNVATVRLAVAGLHGRFTVANGREPELIQGHRPGPQDLDVFHDQKEVSAAINDPRYKTSEAYRQAVAAKLGRSK